MIVFNLVEVRIVILTRVVIGNILRSIIHNRVSTLVTLNELRVFAKVKLKRLLLFR